MNLNLNHSNTPSSNVLIYCTFINHYQINTHLSSYVSTIQRPLYTVLFTLGIFDLYKICSRNMVLEELDDDVDWPVDQPLGRKMDILQECLLCPICQDFFTNPQMLKCGHTYCSLCIQRHCDSTLNRTNPGYCPSCREKADPFDMRKNTLIATVVEHYKNARKDIFDLLMQRTNVAEEVEVEEAAGSRTSRRLKDQHTSTSTQVNGNNRGHKITSKLTHFHLHGLSKEKVKKIIEDVTKESKIKLRVDGEKDALERRLRELVHLANAQIDAENPLTLDEAIQSINQQEKSKETETKRLKVLQMQGQVRYP